MQCVEVFRNFVYRPKGVPTLSVQFVGGTTYRNVIEAAANAIVAAGAGRVLNGSEPTDVDAWECFQRKGK